MTFTYDPNSPSSSDLWKTRLELGDTNEDFPLFQDAELTVLIDREGSVQLGAAAACDVLANRFAREYDYSDGEMRFSAGQRAKAYREQAKRLRALGRGLGSIRTKRVDANSDDIFYDEVTSTSVNPRRRYYGQEDDLP